MASNGRLIVFNWKENPRTLTGAFRLFSAIMRIVKNKKRGNTKVVICPPSVYLAELSRLLVRLPVRFSLGAQDIFWKDSGAYTGEIGPAMLRSFGKKVQYVIIGHSERRRYFHETDSMVNKKVRAALAAGLRVILCVGEPLAVRKRGIVAARRYVKNQLKKDLQGIINAKLKIKSLIIAYEPIWAIGTGRNCPPEDARDMAIFIKEARSRQVLYGGSVDGANVVDYLCYHEVSGVLVGGASLRVGEVGKMIKNS